MNDKKELHRKEYSRLKEQQSLVQQGALSWEVYQKDRPLQGAFPVPLPSRAFMPDSG